MPQGVIARLPLGPLASRPRLVGAIAVGLACALALHVPPAAALLKPSTQGILSWDAACLWFIGASLASMSGKTTRQIRERAARQDDGRGIILGLTLTATAASLAAAALELSLAKGDHGLAKTVRPLLAFLTVACSWMVAQLIFAFHYAHEYYTGETDDPASPAVGGLKFPEGGDPDYWDFLHFSIIIGVASQTADVAFDSRKLRRIGTVHSLVAYAYNTVVVALTINLWAGIF